MGREFSRIRLLPSLTKGSLSTPGSIHLHSTPKHPPRAATGVLLTLRAKVEPLLRMLVVGRRKNIRIIHGLVTGLVAKGDTKKLTSVTYTTGSDTTEQGASLIVDCSGLARVGLKLLKRLVNSEAFETKTYSPNIRYATVPFKGKDDMKGRLPITRGIALTGGFILISH